MNVSVNVAVVAYARMSVFGLGAVYVRLTVQAFTVFLVSTERETCQRGSIQRKDKQKSISCQMLELQFSGESIWVNTVKLAGDYMSCESEKGGACLEDTDHKL